tara:strand:+ start:4300 stop:4473 length:174 start_codon:yes stop_codon:yes gene_type:complete
LIGFSVDDADRVAAVIAVAAGVSDGATVGITGGDVLVAVFPQAAVTASRPAAIARIT